MRSFFRGVLAAALSATSATALPQATPRTEERLLFAVNEGAAGLQDASEIYIKYEEFMGFIGKTLGKKVLFHLARDFGSLDAGMRNSVYQLVLVRPTNFAARAVRDYSYNLVVVTRGGNAPHFIVRHDTHLESLQDLRGLRIALPPEDAYMSLITKALLREQGMDLHRDMQPSFYRDQAVIGHAVEMGMVDVGVIASVSKIAGEWDKKGRTAIKGAAQIVMPLIASPALGREEIAKLRNALVGLDKTEDGKRLLKSIGSPGFEMRDTQDLIELMEWLGM